MQYSLVTTAIATFNFCFDPTLAQLNTRYTTG